MGGVGDDFCLFLYSGPLTSVEESDSNPIVEDGVCITSLLVLVDRAQVKRGRGKLGPDYASPLSQSGGGGLVRLFLQCFLVSLTSVLCAFPLSIHTACCHQYSMYHSGVSMSLWLPSAPEIR